MHTSQTYTSSHSAVAWHHLLQIVQRVGCQALRRLATVQLSTHRGQHLH